MSDDHQIGVSDEAPRRFAVFELIPLSYTNWSHADDSAMGLARPMTQQEILPSYAVDMRLLLKLLINAAALWAAGLLVSGIDLEGSVWAILLAALVFGLVNTFIKPILKLLSLPVMIVTLGLFAVIINAGMLLLTGWLTDALEVADFWSALLGAIVISVVSAVLNVFVPND